MSLEFTPLTKELYHYILSISLREPPICEELRIETKKRDKNYNMQINPDTGQLLSFLLQLMGAKHCLEIGSYMGYSALWLALHLPHDGNLVVCEINPDYAKIADAYWKKAAIKHKIQLHVGPALGRLEKLREKKGTQDFDMVFIDADKINYSRYYETCFHLIRPGGLIAFDNTLWGGDVTSKEANSSSTQAIQELNARLFHDKRIDITLLPIGDGLTLIRKK